MKGIMPMKRFLALLASVIVLAGFFQGGTFAQEPAISCVPNGGEYGLMFYIVGEGFMPASTIQIEIFDTPTVRKADDEGKFRLVTFAPTDESKFPPGDYEIVATDGEGGSARCSFRLREVVSPIRPPVGPVSASPTPPPAPTPTYTPVPSPSPARENPPTLFIGLGVITAVGLAILAFVLFFTIIGRETSAPKTIVSHAPEKRTPVEDFSSPTLPEISPGDSTVMMPSLPVLTARASLSIVRGENEGAQFVLEKKTTFIGRDEDCDIVIPEAVVSRHHAKIVRVGSKYYLYDLKSTNGTLVNGRRIDQHLLQNGDEIQVGVSVLLFEREAEGE